ncbi:MAG: GNAT family N-acetyltransferase [Elioraea sp.]|nr:GNAT family N-acetyltransferase [Elioraea sp.]MDW8445286.1 GNAT family N-acetyltransferase [Acetobacteraceae bacterium]
MSSTAVTLRTVSGEAIRAHLDDLARLRIAVFRDWPYLYDGDEAYERRYLDRYAEARGAAVVLALAEGRVVGASTCLPLAEEDEEISAPFREAGWDLQTLFYFGESVLLPAYRGRGIGVAFFAEREAWALRFPGITWSAFCAVERDPADPRRPSNYVPLDAFWRRRGYEKRPDLACTLEWREVGATEETPHRLTFWLKRLRQSP